MWSHFSVVVDPLILDMTSDIFRVLSSNKQCVGSLQARLVPTLVSILTAPLDKIPLGMQSVCRNGNANLYIFIFVLFFSRQHWTSCKR